MRGKIIGTGLVLLALILVVGTSAYSSVDAPRNADVDVAPDKAAYVGLDKVDSITIPSADPEYILTVTNQTSWDDLKITVEVVPSDANVQYLSTSPTGKSEEDDTPKVISFYLDQEESQDVYMKASSGGKVRLRITAESEGFSTYLERTVEVKDTSGIGYGSS